MNDDLGVYLREVDCIVLALIPVTQFLRHGIVQPQMLTTVAGHVQQLTALIPPPGCAQVHTDLIRMVNGWSTIAQLLVANVPSATVQEMQCVVLEDTQIVLYELNRLLHSAAPYEP